MTRTKSSEFESRPVHNPLPITAVPYAPTLRKAFISGVTMECVSDHEFVGIGEEYIGED
ncbi:MAG: hypothetical protein ACFFB7_05920 [Candidatus Sifarchaeia archaeon]